MRKIAVFGLTAALALAPFASDYAWAGGPKERLSLGISPEGAFCARGPVFEEIRSVTPIEGADELGSTKLTQDASLRGKYFTKVKFYYESQPAVFVEYETMPGFPPETVYMAKQFRPKSYDGWIRVDFNALVAVTPAPGDFAGLAYSLYVKEDGGDGTIENPGVPACGGDDTCGYLEQTFNAPWLVATSNEFSWVSVARSDFFKAQGQRRVEVQVHLYPIHEAGQDPGNIIVNNGLLAFSSGMP